MYTEYMYNNSLCHYGVKGQEWGERRYQNEDGSYTPLGREHRAKVDHKAVIVNTKSNSKTSSSNSSTNNSTSTSTANSSGVGAASVAKTEEKKTETNQNGSMTVGSKGDNVKALQQKLIDAGYDLHEFGANGIFGRRTKAALMKYQQDNGLTVDGIAGPETLAAMDSDSKSTTTNSSNSGSGTTSKKSSTKKSSTSSSSSKSSNTTKTTSTTKKTTNNTKKTSTNSNKTSTTKSKTTSAAQHKINFKKALKTTKGKALTLNEQTQKNLDAKKNKNKTVSGLNTITRQKNITSGTSSVKKSNKVNSPSNYYTLKYTTLAKRG